VQDDTGGGIMSEYKAYDNCSEFAKASIIKCMFDDGWRSIHLVYDRDIERSV